MRGVEAEKSNLDKPCPKCGGATRMRWEDGSEVPEYARFTLRVRSDTNEHLRVTCQVCGYEWLEKPLDAGAE